MVNTILCIQKKIDDDWCMQPVCHISKNNKYQRNFREKLLGLILEG